MPKKKTDNLNVGGPTGQKPQFPRRSKSKQVSGDTRAPTLKMIGYVQANESIVSKSMEFHMTIRTKVSDLKPRQASLLLAVAVTKAITLGVDFSLYMAIEFLNDFLRKSGQDPLFITEEKQRQTVLLSELILLYIRGDWFDFLEKEKLPESLVQQLVSTEWLPAERTLRSWGQHWDLEKYLKIQIVPVDTFRRRNKKSTAERYSAYTRGYGNDGSPPEPGKTKGSPELDGSTTDRPPPSFTLLEFEKYVDIQNSIEAYKARRKQNK